MATKRNGKIELLRFIFCLLVVLYHTNEDLWDSQLVFGEYFSFFLRSNLAVGFFFLVSGFFLAKAALKPKGENYPLGKESVTFMKKKILGILPTHIICFTVTFILICCINKVSLPEFFADVFKVIPSFFCLNRAGVAYMNVMPVEWYISAMLFSMVFLFPLCRKFGKTFTNIIAPIVGFTIIGYSLNKYGMVMHNNQWDVLCCNGILRATCEMCFGATAYSISEKLKTLNFSKADKIFLTVIEVFCFCFGVFWTVTNSQQKWDGVTFLILFVAISICMSDVTYYPEFFDSRIITFAGKASLPIYLSQDFARKFVEAYITSVPKAVQALLIFAISIALGLIVMQAAKPLDKAIRNKLSNINLPKQTYIPKFSKNNQD